jgi:hypothetical protein
MTCNRNIIIVEISFAQEAMFCVDRSKRNMMLEMLFNRKGTVHQGFIIKWCTLNKSMHLQGAAQCGGLQLWHSDNWLLQHSVPAHQFTLLYVYLAKDDALVILQAPEIPHLPMMIFTCSLN